MRCSKARGCHGRKLNPSHGPPQEIEPPPPQDRAGDDREPARRRGVRFPSVTFARYIAAVCRAAWPAALGAALGVSSLLATDFQIASATEPPRLPGPPFQVATRVPRPTGGAEFQRHSQIILGEGWGCATFDSERGKIHQIHMRNIRGGLNDFLEVYPDEGDMDFSKVMRILRDTQFAYSICADHMPSHPDDPGKLQAFAFGNGYIKALIHAVNAEVT